MYAEVGSDTGQIITTPPPGLQIGGLSLPTSYLSGGAALASVRVLSQIAFCILCRCPVRARSLILLILTDSMYHLVTLHNVRHNYYIYNHLHRLRKSIYLFVCFLGLLVPPGGLNLSPYDVQSDKLLKTHKGHHRLLRRKYEINRPPLVP
jgi:hypothetical protein